MDKSDPPDVQLTDYGWEMKEHKHVMPAISRDPTAPSKLMTSSGAAAKRRAKSAVEGVAMDPMECRVPAILCP